MAELPKRLTPTPDTVRELYLKSGNMCAFPGCSHLIMDADGVFVGQLCHIEAAEKGGQRFNDKMTNEERRAPANLMLMCHAHHKVTDNVKKFSSDRMREMKANHEARFSSADRTILATLKDWTTTEGVTFAKNLRALDRVMGWKHSEEDLSYSTEMLGQYVEEKVRLVPMPIRSFLGKVAVRANRLDGQPAVGGNRHGFLITCQDLEDAFGISAEVVMRHVHALNSYGLGRLDEMELGEYVVPALLVRSLDGWDFWGDLAKFCAVENVAMERFTEELNFSSLDE